MVLVLPASARDQALRVPYFVLYFLSTISIFLLCLIILKARLRRHVTFYSVRPSVHADAHARPPQSRLSLTSVAPPFPTQLFLSVILNGLSNIVQ